MACLARASLLRACGPRLRYCELPQFCLRTMIRVCLLGSYYLSQFRRGSDPRSVELAGCLDAALVQSLQNSVPQARGAAAEVRSWFEAI